MSLIIGRADSGRVIIFGDTKLTFRNSKNSNPYVDGCLKQYIVNDNLAFGFAGIVEHFELALPALLKCDSATAIAETALKIKTEKELDFDLLIGEVDQPNLTILKGDKISSSPVGYIGDKDAFEQFQKYFIGQTSPSETDEGRAQIRISLQPEPLWENDVYGKMFEAFKNTLHVSGPNTVGGIVVPLCTHKGKFQYMTYVDILSDPINLAEFSEQPKVIEFGTAAHGAFSVELADATPNGGTTKDIGFYFLQGGFGLVFHENRNHLKVPKVILADNPAFWVLNSSLEYGAGVASGYMTPDHCGIAGERFMQSGNWKEALFCYELGKDAKDFPQRPAVYDRFMAGYAVAQFNSGKPSEAIALLEKTLELHPASQMCREYLLKLKAATSEST